MLKPWMNSFKSKKFLLFICAVVIVVICLLSIDHRVWHPHGNELVKLKRIITQPGGCKARNMLASFRNYEDVSKFDTCSRIFYNRVPKCASRTVLSSMRVLSKQRGFTLFSAPRGPYYTLHTSALVTNFTRQFSALEEPFIYSRHMYFFNFTEYDMEQPVYINVIRDPLQRAVSHYYYSMYGSSSKPFNNTSSVNQTYDMKECIYENKCRTFFNVILPFFCGHKKFCWRARTDHEKSHLVAVAKQVIRQHYLVVGLTEDLPAFLEVLEGYMPSFFSNATNVFNDIGGLLKAKYKTVKKSKLDIKLEKRLRRRLAPEYELYNFVKQRFYNQLKKVRTWKEQNGLRHIFKDVIDGKPIDEISYRYTSN